MSSQTFPQNVEPEKSGEMTQMPKKIGNSFQTFRNSANILTPLSSESSMHVDPCLSLLCFHGFFRDQVRFCSQLCHNPLNLHTAWEFLYVVTNKQAFSNRPTFTLCCLKGNSACQCGMAVENTRSSHQHAPKSAKRPLLEWTGRFVLLLVQYAGSLVICKGWRRPNTMDIEKSGDLSGCHCAKSCRTMRFCSFMSHQQGTWTKQVQICTYARMHEVPSPTGQFLDLISYRKYIYIYTNAYTNICSNDHVHSLKSVRLKKKKSFSHVYRTGLLVNPVNYLLHGHSRIFGPAQQLSTDALLDVLRVNMLSEQLYHCIFQLSVLLDLLIILLIDCGFPWSWGFRCGVHMLLAIQLQDTENAVAWWIANDYNDWGYWLE